MVELKFLFWNTNKKKCLNEIYNLVFTNNIDIIILLENEATSDEILLKLNHVKTSYYPQNPLSTFKKIKIVTKFHFDFIAPIYESSRFTIRNLELPTMNKVNLVCVHLMDKGNNNEESQSETCSILKQEIEKIETISGHTRTIVVGDFNMNPFEKGVIKANGLHAVISHKIAKQTSRTVSNNTYNYFYNPTWGLYKDLADQVPGTFYYNRAELVNYQWNIFDQIIMRPSLIDNFPRDKIFIANHDGTKKLVTKSGIPNKQLYSDHLPLIFNFKF